MSSDGIPRFRDFSGEAEPISFQVGSEVFQAHDDIPLKHLARLGDLGADLEATGNGTGNIVLKILRVFERLLTPESYERFAKAVNGESEISIGVNRIRAIIPWILEQYGMRPTEAPSSFSDTSIESGESLTGGAVHAELTAETLNPFADSISFNSGSVAV